MAEKRKRGLRKDGRYQVSLVDGVRPDGKPHRRYFYGDTITEAARARDEYRGRISLGIEEDKRITVSEWIDRWIEIYSINAEMYAPYIKRLRADLGRRTLSDIREADLVLSLKAFTGRSSSGATKYRMILQRVFLKAKKNRLITFDPAEDLELPKLAESKGHRALTRPEIDSITSNWHRHRAGLWALLMLYAGLRRGELIALTWDNIDLDGRQLRVAQTAVVKGNQTIIEPRAKTLSGLRCVPLCAVLYNALCAVPADKRTGFVCKSVKGEKLTEAAFSRGWEGFCLCLSRIASGKPLTQQGRRADLIGKENTTFTARPHDLRHTFATMLYDAGVDVKAASYLLGHSDSRITLEIYTHLSAERAKASAASLVGVLDGFSGLKNS